MSVNPAPAPVRPSAVRQAVSRAAHALRVVVHDPQVDRAGKSLAGVVVVRLLLAAGASDALVHLVGQILHVSGV